jgi:uncharacterized Fe-S cluster protein YjdI
VAPSERSRTGTRDYEGDGIVVHWEPGLCIHSAVCVRGLPAVFDPEARPWVEPTRASADEVAAVVDACPSRALTYTRTDGAAEGPGSRAAVASAGTEAVATLRPDGPLVVMGELRVLDAEGNELSQGARHFFCRCGGSQNKPFCDGTHKRNGFTG